MELPQRTPFHRGTVPDQVLGVQRLETRLSEPSAVFGRVDPYLSQLVELLDRYNDRLAVPVRSKQIAGIICPVLAGDVEAVFPVAAVGSHE